MRKFTLLICLISLALFSSWNSFKRNEKFTVVLDAGHGGHDPGALGKITTESKITLGMALELGRILKEHLPDVNVIYTRKTDKFVELYKRGDIANEANADLFISIHCNASSNKNVRGAESFVVGLHVEDKTLNEVVHAENSVIEKEQNFEENYANLNVDSPELMIRVQNLMAAHLNNSITFAEKIQSQFETRVGRHNRGIKQAGFVVLWKTNMPSILIESGFISNVEEEKYLMSKRGQELMASGIYRAIKAYKAELGR